MNKNLTHQISRAALTLLMMLTMSLTASATIITLTPNGNYAQLFDGDTLTGTGGINTHIEIMDGATVYLSGVDNTTVGNDTILHRWPGIICYGDAVIVLCDTTTNRVKGGYGGSGIYVPEGHTLTIQGSGTLIATGGQFGAGIGSGFGIIDDINYSVCGNIIISGGIVTATGGHYATGIGSSCKNSDCGSITISGGTVTATGGQYGAGIGSGYKNSDCGSITISGGTVTATGGQYGAGIGSGNYYSECSSINITGGTVTATGGKYAAGIGSGYNHSNGWHMYFSGGTITANGGERAAGIGSGDDHSSCRDITITSGVTQVTANKGTNATYTIGPGNGNSTCGYITINSYETGFITQSPYTTFSYTIAFNANGGTGQMSAFTAMYNFATTLTSNHYTRPGYLFEGWATSANGPKVYNDGQSVSNLTQTPGDTVTLYAKWVWYGTIPGELLLHDGDVLTGTGGPHTHVSIAEGATVTFSGVDITAILEDNNHQWPGITCLGDAIIVLAEGTTNSVKGGKDSPGIYVPQNKTLTLQGNGTLNATGGDMAAGIGGSYGSSCGNITISGGTITANGGDSGAGIGSGKWFSCGSITISGGTVTATGGSGGVGIGGSMSGSCGDITINGGTVTANGGETAAGIGSGRDSSCEKITISGGTVTANGGEYAAGIGSGWVSTCGTVTITNGVTRVTATAGQDCNNAIGAGNDGSCGTITIGGVETGFITQSPFTTFPYTVAFNANGGSGIMADMSFMYSFAQSLTPNSFTLSGAEYEGWATTPNGPKVYNDGQNVNNLTQTSGATVSLYAKWAIDPTHLSVSGNEYTIHTTTGWDLFCALLASNSAGFFTGKTVKLAANITVTAMAGSWTSDTDYHAFTGTFNGQGHTLTLNYSSNETHCAPFRVIDGATIQDLHLAGTINAGDQFAAMVGHAYGDCNFTNCRSSITINSSRSGYGTHGGFVGRVRTGTSNFVGCVFDGFFSGPNTHAWGGFVGHVESTSHANFTNCLFAPANSSFDFDTYDSQTFARLRYDNPDYATFTNCYYTKVLGGAQGIQAYSITAGENVTVAFNGSATTTYSVSGISVFSAGFGLTPLTPSPSGEEVLYAGDGETLSLNLGCTPPSGTTFFGYQANAGTLSGTENPYTLTMPDENVTIQATLLQGMGTSTDPYLITSADDWDTFAQSVTNGTTFSDQFVQLTADITVTTMAGTRSSDSNYHAFSGTFNGNEHTLTLDYSTTLSDGAPFRVINGATLHDLHIAGTIQTSGQFNGVVGHAYGTNSFTNCRSTITINSTREGDGTHGGFVGVIGSGTTTFTGCVFDGAMLGASTTLCGGFVGWTESNNNATATITNCLFAPTTLEISSGCTFSRARNLSSVTVTNSYYTINLGTRQGIQALTHEAISAVGEATATYDVSGISAYVNGMQYGTAFYYDPDRNFLRSIAGHTTSNGGWNLIASPIAGSTNVGDIGGLISNTASHYDLYRFNQEANKEWENYKANSPTNHPDFTGLENGRGYLYAHSTDTTLVFSGTPYSDNGEVTLTKTAGAEFEGWNLIGNPFGTTATLEKPFYVMNPETHDEIIAATGNSVAAMEGIFVEAATNGEIVTFTQASRATDNDEERLVLDLGHDDAVIDRAIVRLGEGQTLPKFQMRDNSTKIYIPQDGTDYAVAVIARRNDEAIQPTEQPIHFKPSENGTYTLTVSTTINSQLSTLNYLHLVDNMTGADVDLLTPPAFGHPLSEGDVTPPACGHPLSEGDVPTYTFTAKTTDYASRFKLVFSICGDADDDNEAPFAFINNGNIIVNGEGMLQVVDVMGRVIVSVGGHTRCVPTAGMPAGVYILRLIDGDVVKTQKIVIP